MGVDLKLLVVDGNCGSWGYAHTMMEFGRNYEAFDKIKEHCQPQARPEFKLSSYASRVPDGKMEGEACYGDVTETPYGEPITYVYANKIVEALKDTKLYQWQIAAVAYLNTLPPETLVGLYWH